MSWRGRRARPQSVGAFVCFGLCSTAPYELFSRRLLRMFGDVGAVSLMEQASKFIFRRTRPRWASKSTFYCMPAEWWSFPSGHAMRAGYLAAVMSGHTSPLHFTAPEWMVNNQTLLSSTLYFIAAGVCWSRIALGKHFTLDVAVGLAMGLTLGKSGYPAVEADGLLRVVLGSLFTTEAVLVVSNPRWRKLVKGYYILVGINVVFWITMFYAV